MYHAAALEFGLSDSEFWILYCMRSDSGPITQKSICDKWSFNKKTINSGIKRLVTRGIIDILPFPGNKKNKIVQLTPAGTEFMEKTLDRVIRAENSMIEKMPEDEMKIFIQIFEKETDMLCNEIGKLLIKRNHNR
jgi:DNA-binding MarR family transcriptional regulator